MSSDSLLAAVGSEKDDFARLFVSQLSARGVDCSLMQRYERVPMGSCAVLSTSKDRAFVSCLGTNHHLAVDALKQPSVFPFLHSCHHLHISGYFSLPLLQCTAMTELCRELRSSEKGLTISLDTQDDGPNSWLGRGGHLRELLGEIDLFMPNENEAVRIATALRNASSSSTSSSASSSAASSSSSSALCTIPESVSILTDVLPRGALLVLKLGEKGAAVFRDGKMLAAHAAFQVRRCGSCVHVHFRRQKYRESLVRRNHVLSTYEHACDVTGEGGGHDRRWRRIRCWLHLRVGPHAQQPGAIVAGHLCYSICPGSQEGTRLAETQPPAGVRCRGLSRDACGREQQLSFARIARDVHCAARYVS